ncbi:MAG: TIR domain-containing protein [Thermoplasmatota archaeon]
MMNKVVIEIEKQNGNSFKIEIEGDFKIGRMETEIGPMMVIVEEGSEPRYLAECTSEVSEIVFDDKNDVTSCHAFFYWRGGSLFIRDVGSEIGTYINNKMITGWKKGKESSSYITRSKINVTIGNWDMVIEPVRSEKPQKQKMAMVRRKNEDREAITYKEGPSPWKKPGIDVETSEMGTDVDFSVALPSSVKRDTTFKIHFWAHLESDQELIEQIAKEKYRDEEFTLETKGSYPLKSRTDLRLHLKIEDLQVTESVEHIYWNGKMSKTYFKVRVPSDVEFGEKDGTIFVYARDCLIARMDFSLNVTMSGEGPGKAVPDKIRYRSAFVSYSTMDTDEVLARIQGIRAVAPYMDIFFDKRSIDQGEDWKERIRNEIIERDILYLFWSKNSASSSYVDEEWRLAYSNKGADSILPIPLRSSKDVPPPKELSHLHFYDWTLNNI